jgi:glutamate racemase
MRIGVFDSGVGGLSLLPALQRQLPEADWHYLADSAHSPYGERSDADIRERCGRITAHLVAHGAQLVVVACNTATAVAMDTLRVRHAPLPLVGVEPGVRPARARSRNGRIGIMATDATLRSVRFRALIDREAAGATVVTQACTGLAAAIDDAALSTEAIRALIERHVVPLRAAGVDTVALGCTHYPFVRHEIGAALGSNVTLIDTAEAVAAQVARVARRLAPAEPDALGRPCRLHTTGDVDRLCRFVSRWLPELTGVEVRAVVV